MCLAALQLAQAETTSFFRILLNLSGLGTKAWHYTYSVEQGGCYGGSEREKKNHHFCF